MARHRSPAFAAGACGGRMIRPSARAIVFTSREPCAEAVVATKIPSASRLSTWTYRLRTGLSKRPVDREADPLRLRPPGGVADQCSHARRILIDEWARKVRCVPFRQGVAVVQIDKPARSQKVGH